MNACSILIGCWLLGQVTPPVYTAPLPPDEIPPAGTVQWLGGTPTAEAAPAADAPGRQRSPEVSNPISRLLDVTDPANRTGADPGTSAEDGIYPGLSNPIGRALHAADPANRTGTYSGASEPAASGGGSVAIPPPIVSRAVAPAVVSTPASPKELLAAALRAPTGTRVSGQHYGLLDVLGPTMDRSKRLEIAHAYWHLVHTMADLRFCVDQQQQVGQLRAGAVDAKLFRAAEGFAQRELEAAELAAMQAQYELAEAAGLPAGAALPLPSDRPHVGAYSTHFERMFASRQPPRGARLINRTLPLRLQTIEVRSSAVGMMESALQAVSASYSANQLDLGAVLASIRHWTRQRQAWMAAVCDYNHAIADYALMVAGPETSGRELVSMLIELPPRTLRHGAGDRGASTGPTDSAVMPAEFLRAVPDDGVPAAAGDAAGAAARVPTLAPPRTDRADSSTPGQPTLAPPRDPFSQQPAPAVLSEPSETAGLLDHPTTAQPSAVSEGEKTPAVANPETQLPADGGGYDGRSPDNLSEAPRWSDSSRVVPDDTTQPADTVLNQDLVPVAPLPYRAYKPPSSLADGPRYAALAELQPAVRTSRLAGQLFGDVAEPEPAGEKVSLEACLRGHAGSARGGLIRAYWTAVQRVAEYGACVQRTELLDELASAAMLGSVGTPSAIARIRATRLAADADVLDAHVRLLAAKFELTRLVGRPLDSAWLIPSTGPHAGPYELRIQAQPRRLVESWPVRRLAVTIPALFDSVANRAAEVMTADADRAAAMSEYRQGRATFDAALGAVDHQIEETSALVELVSVYNQSIADYVLQILPSATPDDRLVSTLVVVR